jgi:predicted NAD/FAD-dependent oxidoreductase
VIGAGIAGLTAARTLHDQGHRVVVFEKSRGLGGRSATRRINTLGFDHGAQYFTADHPTFKRAVTAWLEQGVVMRWHPRVGRVDQRGVHASPDERERYVAQPGMSALGRHLAQGLEVFRQVRIAPLAPKDAEGWRLYSEEGDSLGRFDAVIVAAPAPQAADLLRQAAPRLAKATAGVDYRPAWSVMAEAACADPAGFDALFFSDSALSWAACNSSKPQRSGNTWVLHASPDWTGQRLDAAPGDIERALVREFCEYLAIDPSRIQPRSCHRWLYSRTWQSLDVGALWDGEQKIAACGDWCQGEKIEGAFISGQAAAGYLLRDQVALSRAKVPTA